jgi:hypothetical protein
MPATPPPLLPRNHTRRPVRLQCRTARRPIPTTPFGKLRDVTPSTGKATGRRRPKAACVSAAARAHHPPRTAATQAQSTCRRGRGLPPMPRISPERRVVVSCKAKEEGLGAAPICPAAHALLSLLLCAVLAREGIGGRVSARERGGRTAARVVFCCEGDCDPYTGASLNTGVRSETGSGIYG